MVTPIVTAELINKRMSQYLTPEPGHYLEIISKFTKPIFNNAEELFNYGMNTLGEHGTSIFILDLKGSSNEG